MVRFYITISTDLFITFFLDMNKYKGGELCLYFPNKCIDTVYYTLIGYDCPQSMTFIKI